MPAAPTYMIVECINLYKEDYTSSTSFILED